MCLLVAAFAVACALLLVVVALGAARGSNSRTNSQLAVAAAEKLQPPEGVCYKQRPTVRTWPARYRRQSMSLAILPLILQSSVLYRDFLDRFEQVRPDRGQSVQCVSDCTLARDILLFALEFELS